MKGGPQIAIIGAGAAGCFCGCLLGAALPKAEITIFESGPKPMSKLARTGGGRCNITNSFRDISVEKAYPRGGRLMKHLMKGFSNEDLLKWFQDRGVAFVTQKDQCVFPKSQDAMQIVNTLLDGLGACGAKVLTGNAVSSIVPSGAGSGYVINETFKADAVVMTVGGLSSARIASIFRGLDIRLEKPVPSLFTLKTQSAVKSLSGTVVSPVKVSLAGTKLSAEGPILITDWGFSGPAVLKLSSYAARELSGRGYKGDIVVNWMPEQTAEGLERLIKGYASTHPDRNVATLYPEKLTSRLWNFILGRSEIKENVKFAGIGQKSIRRLVAVLMADSYVISGRGRARDEFVTCGGVALDQIDAATLESKLYPGLYFAGEVLDIDAITGGFNLQAAWTTAYTVAKAIETRYNGIL